MPSPRFLGCLGRASYTPGSYLGVAEHLFTLFLLTVFWVFLPLSYYVVEWDPPLNVQVGAHVPYPRPAILEHCIPPGQHLWPWDWHETQRSPHSINLWLKLGEEAFALS